MSFPRSPRFPPDKNDILASPADYNLRELDFVPIRDDCFNRSIRISKSPKKLSSSSSIGVRFSIKYSPLVQAILQEDPKVLTAEENDVKSCRNIINFDHIDESSSSDENKISRKESLFKNNHYKKILNSYAYDFEEENTKSQRNVRISSCKEKDDENISQTYLRDFHYIDELSRSRFEDTKSNNDRFYTEINLKKNRGLYNVDKTWFACNNTSANRNLDREVIFNNLGKTFLSDADCKERHSSNCNHNKSSTDFVPICVSQCKACLQNQLGSFEDRDAKVHKETLNNKKYKRSRNSGKENKPVREKSTKIWNIRLDDLREKFNGDYTVPENKTFRSKWLKYGVKDEPRTSNFSFRDRYYSHEEEANDNFKKIVAESFLEMHRNMKTTNRLLRNIESLLNVVKERHYCCYGSMKLLSEQLLSVVSQNSLSEQDVFKMWDYFDINQAC